MSATVQRLPRDDLTLDARAMDVLCLRPSFECLAVRIVPMNFDLLRWSPDKRTHSLAPKTTYVCVCVCVYALASRPQIAILTSWGNRPAEGPHHWEEEAVAVAVELAVEVIFNSRIAMNNSRICVWLF